MCLLTEAYVQYCYSPKHTVGEQLLAVRRDKRERAAYGQSQRLVSGTIEESGVEVVEHDEELEDRYSIAI
jgi:hypothetical protein